MSIPFNPSMCSGTTRRLMRTPAPVRASSSSSGQRVTACVYGHMHIEGQWPRRVQGTILGVRYHCVAADAIGFRPLRIASNL